MSRLTDAALAALPAHVARVVQEHRAHIGRLTPALERAERQVRDMAMENERLRAENARLRALVGKP
jgi:regulator of replication initiation timing